MLRRKLFEFLSAAVTRHNKAVLIVCAVITVAMIAASGRLGMKTQISDMLPKGIPQIEEFERIIDDFQSASTVILTVESDKKDVARMKICADDMAARLKDLVRVTPAEGQKLGLVKKIQMLQGKSPLKGVQYDTTRLVRRIDYKMDNDFMAEHGMMMQKTDDLENFQNMFGSLDLPGIFRNINDNFEKEYVDDSDNLNSLEGEEEAVQGLAGMYKFVNSMGDYLSDGDTAKVRRAVRDFVSGPEYMISSDNTMLLIMLQPAISWDDMEAMLNLAYQVFDSLHVVQKDYPDLHLSYSGGVMLQIDETEAMKKDFGWPSVGALVLILVLLIGSFRTWKNPFFSVTVLVVGIIWAAGILALILKYLNMMSASFGIILIGLGIDFGIHFISGFRDGREKGLSVEDAIKYMYEKVGAGVITGGMTTAVVFLSLSLTRFKAFTEMGIAVGGGIMVIMIAMFIMLPALVVWDNKGYSVIGNLFRRVHLGFVPVIWSGVGKGIMFIFRLPIFSWISAPLQFRFLEGSGRLVSKTPVAAFIIIICAVSIYFSFQAAKTIEFEYDMMELEPVGIPTAVTQDKIIEKFEIAPDYALLTADNLDDCREKVRLLKKAGNRTDLIGRVDAITEFIPQESVQKQNIEPILAFRKRMSRMPIPGAFNSKDLSDLAMELKRLDTNMVEIGELAIAGSGEDNRITRKCDEIVGKSSEESKLLALAARLKTSPKALEAMKEYQRIAAEVLKQRMIRMTSTDIITLDALPVNIKERYVNPNNERTLITIYPKSQVWEQRHLRKFHEMTTKISDRITGLPAMTLIMLDMMGEKLKVAVMIGACAIALFLLLDFRSLKYMILAGVPLFVGAVWMVGMMAAFGMKYNMANFMAIPLIIGIGIDDGVHILHRYDLEGRGNMPEVLKYTGRAILLTSLTTMIGFGSMGLASHRGLASMGQILFMGVGACFVSSAYLLPSIITLVEKVSKVKTSDK